MIGSQSERIGKRSIVGRMSPTRTALAAALLSAALFVTGCASSTPGESAPAASTSNEPSTPAMTDGTDAPAEPMAGTTLLAVVGSADDPEAYTIGILDEDGNPVTSVPAGDYSLTFVDRSRMHNFHLTGEGVDVATDVQGSDETTVEITLVAGTYEFVCDPHAATMRGALEVTG